MLIPSGYHSLPLRDYINQIGGEILGWDNASKTATARINNRDVSFSVNGNTIENRNGRVWVNEETFNKAVFCNDSSTNSKNEKGIAESVMKDTACFLLSTSSTIKNDFPGFINTRNNKIHIWPKTEITTATNPRGMLGGISEGLGLYFYKNDIEDTFNNPKYRLGQRVAKFGIDNVSTSASIFSGILAAGAMKAYQGEPTKRIIVGSTVVVTTSTFINSVKAKLYSFIGID